MALRAVPYRTPREAPYPSCSVVLRGSQRSIKRINQEVVSAGAVPTWSCCFWCNLGVVSQRAQPVRQIVGGAMVMQVIEITRAEFAIVGSIGQHVISRHQHLVRDGDRGAHLAPFGGEAAVLVREVTAALFGRRDRGGDHRGLKPYVSVSGF